MSADPCEQLNKDWDKIRKPLNDSFRVFPKGINIVVDGMNDLTTSAYDSFNQVVNAVNYITTEPLEPINELTDAVKTFVKTITKLPSLLGVVQILLLPLFIQIKNVLDTIFFFLPNIPLSMIALLVMLIAVFVFVGHILGSLYSVGLVAFRTVDLVSNWLVEPFLNLFLSNLPQVFIDILGWATLALVSFVIIRLFVKIPVPCNCGEAPSGDLLVCQKDSERGSENCIRIQKENEKIAETLTRIKERGARIVSKAEGLFPELPLDLLPSLKVPKAIAKISEQDLFPELGLPKCGAQIEEMLREIEKTFEKAREEAERLAAEAEKATRDAAIQVKQEAERLAAAADKAAKDAANKTKQEAERIANEAEEAAKKAADTTKKAIADVFVKPKTCRQRICTKSKCVKRNFLGWCTKSNCIQTRCLF